MNVNSSSSKIMVVEHWQGHTGDDEGCELFFQVLPPF